MTLRTLLVLCAALAVALASMASAQSGAQARQSKFAAAAQRAGKSLTLDTKSYNEITTAPRNYSLTALLTALQPQFGCKPCKEFQPGYDTLARSWNKKKDPSHFFTTLDFVNGKEVFSAMRMQHAPALLYFPPTAGPRAANDPSPVTYDFNRAGFEIEDLAEWLSKDHGLPIKYSPPFPWQKFAGVAAAALAAGVVVSLAAPRMGGILSGTKILWELITLGTVIIMCSGYMWNQIRGAPYNGVGANGRIEYFAGGFQNQFVAETQIVASIYALLAFSMVALIIFVPNQKDRVRQRAGVYVWSAVFLGTFSLLFAVFRQKNPSYPFRLFL